MHEILRSIWAGFAAASLLDLANLVIGVIGVWLMIKRSLWGFPVNLVGVTVQGVVCFNAKLYADTMVQVFFFCALAWGWWHWVHGRRAAKELPITAMSTRSRGINLLVSFAVIVIWALLLRAWTDTKMPWRDATMAVFSIQGQLLQSRKMIENWPAWAVVNVVAVATYWRTGDVFTAFLYAIYLILGLIGWWEWLRPKPDEAVPAVETARN